MSAVRFVVWENARPPGREIRSTGPLLAIWFLIVGEQQPFRAQGIVGDVMLRRVHSIPGLDDGRMDDAVRILVETPHHAEKGTF